MRDKISVGTMYPLSYKEMLEVKNNDKQSLAKMLEHQRRTVFDSILEQLPTKTDCVHAFIIETKLLDDMNLVTKARELDVNVEHIHVKRVDNDYKYKFERKLTLKERFKIFVKGEF